MDRHCIFINGCDTAPENIEKELTVLKAYAEQYRPPRDQIAGLETPPNEVIDAIQIIKKAGGFLHDSYLDEG